MSRLPSARGGIPAPPQQKRLSRQPSLDLRRRRHHPDDAAPPVPSLKTSKSTRAPSMSRASISSYEEIESPSSLSRYSLSSIGSTQTAITSPRSSVASPRPTSVRKSVASVNGGGKHHPTNNNNSNSMGGLGVGERVAVDSMGIVGTLRFIGTTQFKEGMWAGIQLDIVGTGKNDGSVNGIRYFSCPPQTGLFVQASKVTSLNGRERSPSPRISPGSRAARYVGMTASQLTQQQQQQQQQQRPPSVQTKRSSTMSARSSSGNGLRRPGSIQSPTPTSTRRRPTADSLPSPAATPNNEDEDDEDGYVGSSSTEMMLTDTPAPTTLTMSKSTDSHTRLERMLGEAISQAPDQAAMRVQQLQLRVEVLEAENKYLKLENAQNKTAEQILERSVLLNGSDSDQQQQQQQHFTLEGHKAIVEEIKQEHEQAAKAWDQEKGQIQSTIRKLEERVKELETEQSELIKERDTMQTQLSEARKEKVQMENKVRELEEKVTLAEAAAASKAAAAASTTSNFYSQDPEEMRQRQMQMEMEMEEVHEKMGSLMDAMRAKDMFLGSLSEQVETHRNMVEEREREIRRVKADADRHTREKDRLRDEIKELETKWMQHQDCATKEEFDKVKRQLTQAKESLAHESNVVADYRARIESLEQSVDELKRAGMESIELYESSVELHRVDMEAIKASLDDERRKVIALEEERESLRKAGLEAIETYEATIEELKKERSETSEKSGRTQQEMQATIDKLKQEIEQLVNARDTSDEVDKIKAVWESERKRLEDNLEATSQNLAKEREMYQSLKAESEKLREQIKQADKHDKDNDKLQEQVQRLQANYDEQLNARGKYLDDVRAAVESQKKTEGELRRLTEAKEKTERDLTTAQESLARAESALADARKHGADPDALIKEREQHAKELAVLRQEIKRLEAQNTMITKQKESIELEAKSKSDNGLKQQFEKLQAEHQRLSKEYESLTESHKQAQNECLKLMDEVEKLHSEGDGSETSLEGCNTDEERVARLQSQLSDTKRKMESLIVKQSAEMRQLKEKHEEAERAHQRQVATLNRDVSELESLVESKIFKESDMEEALEKERKQSKRLREELNELKQQLKEQQRDERMSSKNSSTATSSNGPYTDDALFCELCDSPGHDLMSCKVVVPTSSEKKEQPARPFCVNCDEYGLHSTEQCPNQNETF
ncbi:hypothetical protein RO3G_09301 [Lichtheimia corymbifera JMRC:FSU:9682]|uniref:CAP-Gly domain-containing protein n=1 Tax=Lichtheimia corymbifera JMRC:FSU:9682 TaxID=1263082 RepID=A0A068RED3_9FUNG|nr:hypothetical protein RO3G_09301 [Lichtheimia corymbifera JMRC:FSU:9682]